MGFRRLGGVFPRQPLGERARPRSESRHERRIAGEREHAVGQGADVAMWHEKSRLAVSHRLPQARTVGGECGRSTGRRLDVRDAPPLLGTREYHAPRPSQQSPLLLVGHEPQEARGRAEPEPARQALEAPPVVPLTGHVEEQVGTASPRDRQGPERDFHSFITLEPPHVQERRLARPRGIGGIPGRVDARMNHVDPLAWHAPPREVVPRALGDGVEPGPAVRPRDQPLGGPHHGRDGPARLAKRGGAEQVRHER